MNTLLKLQTPAKSSERRREVRVTPDPLLVIRLASGNQGIVLDLSNDGLGFLAGAPVEEDREIRFTLTTNFKPLAEGTGRLMWKDRSGKRAGLQFTQFPAELAALLRKYMPIDRTSRHQEQPHKRVATSVASDQNNVALLEAVSRESASDVSLSQESSSSKERGLDPRLKFAANALTILLACLIAVAIWYSADRRGASQSGSRLKQTISRLYATARSSHLHLPATIAKATTKPLPHQGDTVPTRTIGSRAGSSAAAQPTSLLPAPEKTSTESIEPQNAPTSSPAASTPPPEVVPAKAKPTSEDASQNVNSAAGTSPLAEARQLLKTEDDPENAAKAVQLLWEAVSKGNTAAEIDLADLYLAGQVLPKSCSQARILLTAAQSHKSNVAERKLTDFASYGCQ